MDKAAEAELLRVTKLLSRGRWDDAIGKLQVLVVSTDPEVRLEALDALGNAYASSGRSKDAEEMVLRIIVELERGKKRIGPQLSMLAPLLRRQGRIEEAERTYARALDLLRDDEPELTTITLRNIAYLYWSTGRPEQARHILAEMPDSDEGLLAEVERLWKPYIEPPLPEVP